METGTAWWKPGITTYTPAVIMVQCKNPGYHFFTSKVPSSPGSSVQLRLLIVAPSYMTPYQHALYLWASATHYTVPTCKVSTSDLLYWHIAWWTNQLVSNHLARHPTTQSPNYCKTLYFCCILISRFWNVETLLHLNSTFSQCSTSIYQAFDGQTEFSRVFNFAIFSYSRKFDAHEAHEKYVFYSSSIWHPMAYEKPTKKGRHTLRPVSK